MAKPACHFGMKWTIPLLSSWGWAGTASQSIQASISWCTHPTINLKGMERQRTVAFKKTHYRITKTESLYTQDIKPSGIGTRAHSSQ